MRTAAGFSRWAAFCIVLACLAACTREPEIFDHPQLTASVVMRDVTFHSAALKRDMPYRVVLPAKFEAGQRLPVVYLLHSLGATFRDWSNFSPVAHFAERGLILVMPEGAASYYTNAVARPEDRYEDYMVQDLIADVEARFPANTSRAHRAIVGISMGGFGAAKLALHHPEMFAFVGGLSSAVGAPARPFGLRRMGEWRRFNAIFGPTGAETRKQNDVYSLMQSADPAKTPYFFLTCGEQDVLMAENRRFVELLERGHFHYEFHPGPGGHNWQEWNRQLPGLFDSLIAHMNSQ